MLLTLCYITLYFYGLCVHEEKYQMDAYLDLYDTYANTQPKAPVACLVINSVVDIC